MNKPILIFGASAIGVGVVMLIARKKDGSTQQIDGVTEVEVHAPLIDSPAPAQIRAAWVDPSGRGLKYKPLFDAAERKYGIPAGLLYRQGYQESRFRSDIINGEVVSSAGALGIMQIVPKWHPEIAAGDSVADQQAILNPSTAIDYAGKILSRWKKQYGTWELALAAYNAGPGNVDKYKAVPPFKETQDYVSQIMADTPMGIA